MPPIGSAIYHPRNIEERADMEQLDEAELRRYLATPAGMEALRLGKLDEWIALNGWDEDEP